MAREGGAKGTRRVKGRHGRVKRMALARKEEVKRERN